MPGLATEQPLERPPWRTASPSGPPPRIVSSWPRRWRARTKRAGPQWCRPSCNGTWTFAGGSRGPYRDESRLGRSSAPARPEAAPMAASPQDDVGRAAAPGPPLRHLPAPQADRGQSPLRRHRLRAPSAMYERAWRQWQEWLGQRRRGHRRCAALRRPLPVPTTCATSSSELIRARMRGAAVCRRPCGDPRSLRCGRTEALLGSRQAGGGDTKPSARRSEGERPGVA